MSLARVFKALIRFACKFSTATSLFKSFVSKIPLFPPKKSSRKEIPSAKQVYQILSLSLFESSRFFHIMLTHSHTVAHILITISPPSRISSHANHSTHRHSPHHLKSTSHSHTSSPPSNTSCTTSYSPYPPSPPQRPATQPHAPHTPPPPPTPSPPCTQSTKNTPPADTETAARCNTPP